jgi:hypothetical protein
MGITASSFKLRANDPEGRKAISYQPAYLPPLLFILTMIKKGDDPTHVWHAKMVLEFFLLK